MTVLKQSEADFQATVIEYARLRGWRVAHFHDSRRQVGGRLVGDKDAAGFPDLVLVRAGEMVIVELKAEKGRVKPEQQEWLLALAVVAAGAESDAQAVEAEFGGRVERRVRVYTWRPSDWPTVEGILR